MSPPPEIDPLGGRLVLRRVACRLVSPILGAPSGAGGVTVEQEVTLVMPPSRSVVAAARRLGKSPAAVFASHVKQDALVVPHASGRARAASLIWLGFNLPVVPVLARFIPLALLQGAAAACIMPASPRIFYRETYVEACRRIPGWGR